MQMFSLKFNFPHWESFPFKSYIIIIVVEIRGFFSWHAPILTIFIEVYQSVKVKHYMLTMFLLNQSIFVL